MKYIFIELRANPTDEGSELVFYSEEQLQHLGLTFKDIEETAKRIFKVRKVWVEEFDV